MNILRSFNKLNGRNSETYAKRIQARNYSVKTFCIECPILPLVPESLIRSSTYRTIIFGGWYPKETVMCKNRYIWFTAFLCFYSIDNFKSCKIIRKTITFHGITDRTTIDAQYLNDTNGDGFITVIVALPLDENLHTSWKIWFYTLINLYKS